LPARNPALSGDTKLNEDEQRYGERKGVEVMASLRSLA
jgi:hypothetical protein